jgi:hypothetical protein
MFFIALSIKPQPESVARYQDTRDSPRDRKLSHKILLCRDSSRCHYSVFGCDVNGGPDKCDSSC